MSKEQPPRGFEAILASLNSAVIIFDDDGEVEWLNPSAEAMIGLSEKLMKGRRYDDLFSAETPIAQVIDNAFSGAGAGTEHDTALFGQGEEPVRVDVSAHPVEDPERGGVVVILRDLTARKTLERFLSISEKMDEMATLAAGIAHEIKNPLGGIRGAAQLLDGEVTGEGREYTSLILREVDRIDRLVTQLMEVNQGDSFDCGPINLYPALDDTLRILGPLVAEKGIRFDHQFDPSLPPVHAEEDRLRQIFLNLLKNGVEACRPGGVVTIRTAMVWRASHTLSVERRQSILVEITDEGEGLDPVAEAHLFTPFYSGKKKGTGLGLPMTLHLVRAFDGALEIENRADGHSGVAARLYLPYVP